MGEHKLNSLLMIYLFHGTDEAKVRSKALAWISASRAKEPEAPYVRLSGDEIKRESLEQATQTQGLFFTKMLVLLDDPFSSTTASDVLMEMLDALVESSNPIAILAPKLLASRLKKLEGVAQKVYELQASEKKTSKGFNAPLVNALGARDGKTLWKELMRAQREGDVPEMLHGLLHWKARDMIKKGSRVWKPEEARRLSVELIELVSSARSGDLQLGMALERFALRL